MGSCNNSSNDKRRKTRNKNEKNSENLLSDNNNTNATDNRLQSQNTNQKELNGLYSTNYYLVCPDCLERSPHIEKLYYDEKTNDFLVKYTCICNENTMHSKEILLMKILNSKEPINKCNIHSEKKLINYCKTCRRAICYICKEELHKGHNIDEESINNQISKEDADKMLLKIKEKEQQFQEEIDKNEKKMENGIDNVIQKLNEEKKLYKEQMENYKDNNKRHLIF